MLLAGEEVVEEGELGGGDGGAVGAGGGEIVGVHGDEEGGVGVAVGDLVDGAFADGEVVGEVDLFEGGVFADEFGGEGGGFTLAGDGGGGVAGGPAVVVDVDAEEDVGAGLGFGEDFVAPVLGEGAGEVGVVGMGDEPPAGFGFETEHDWPFV